MTFSELADWLISARFAQDCTYFSNAQYMHKICARLYFFPQCAIYAQDLHNIVLISPMCNICARFVQDCTYFSNAQYMCKIVLLSLMRNICKDLRKIVLLSPERNICTRFEQDCTSFSNAQYMHKICTRLYFFPNAQYMCKISTRLYLFLQCTVYVQDLHKIVLISPMRNICTRFAQNCTSFPNAQYMCKICARLYLFLQCTIYVQDLLKIVLLFPMCNICTKLYFSPQCAIFAQDCRHYWKKYVTYHISALNLEWYSFHSYVWIATSSDSFLNKHL